MRGFLTRYPRLDADRLLRGAGLEPATLGNHDATHSLLSILTFLENAASETRDECFGLEFAMQLPLPDLDVLGYVMLHSPTLEAGLVNASRYYAVQQTLGQLSLSKGPHAQVTYALPVPAGVPTRQLVDVVLAALVKYGREATGQRSCSPLQVQFGHAAPADPSRFEQFFRAPVSFGQPVNALLFSLDDLQLSIESPDPRLLPILQRHADDLLARIPATGTFADTVRRLIIDMLKAGNVAIEDAATRLDTTPRGLQRRLRECGSSYQLLLAETRLALAQRYLTAQTLSLTEIAYLLGYSDLSAFSRAFRRWKGQSPLAFRQRSGRAAPSSVPSAS
jgi:AraC-like DNA-binding protein